MNTSSMQIYDVSTNISWAPHPVLVAAVTVLIHVVYAVVVFRVDKNEDKVKKLEARLATLEEYVKTRSEDLEESLEIVKDMLPEVIGAAIQTAAETLTADVVSAKMIAERASLRIDLLEKPILTALENATKARNQIDGLLRQVERSSQVHYGMTLLRQENWQKYLERDGYANPPWRAYTAEQVKEFPPERLKALIAP